MFQTYRYGKTQLASDWKSLLCPEFGLILSLLYVYAGPRTGNKDGKIEDYIVKGIKVILLSECLYSDVMKYVKREDVFVCPNGIPEE